MARSGYTCIRRVFCWLNISLWLTGFGVLFVALWLRFVFEGYISLLPQYALLSADSILLITGGVTLVLAFLGCCGSWFQNRCLLLTYFSCIILLFEIEIFLAVIAFVFRQFLGETLINELKNGIKHHYNISAVGSNGLVDIWDQVQIDLKCCGVINAADWYHIDAWPSETWVPDSCCVSREEHCGKHFTAELFSRGCADQIHMWFIERLYIIGIIGLIVAFIQLFGLISSMLLFCTVKRRRNSESYTPFVPNGYTHT